MSPSCAASSMPSRARRETAIRRRAAASDGVAKLEGELLAARRDADDARAGWPATAIAELQQRMDRRPSRALAQLHGARAGVPGSDAYASAPSRALQSHRWTCMTGQPALQFTAAACQRPHALPPSLQSLTDLISRLDFAAGLAGAIRQAVKRTQRHYRLLRRAQNERQPCQPCTP